MGLDEVDYPESPFGLRHKQAVDGEDTKEDLYGSPKSSQVDERIASIQKKT